MYGYVCVCVLDRAEDADVYNEQSGPAWSSKEKPVSQRHSLQLRSSLSSICLLPFVVVVQPDRLFSFSSFVGLALRSLQRSYATTHIHLHTQHVRSRFFF